MARPLKKSRKSNPDPVILDPAPKTGSHNQLNLIEFGGRVEGPD